MKKIPAVRAESIGFEPMVQLPAHLISNQALSSTQATFRSGKYRIRTYGTASRSLDFESSPIDHSGNFPPHKIMKRANLSFVAHKGFEPLILRMRISRPGPARRMRHSVWSCKITTFLRTDKIFSDIFTKNYIIFYLFPCFFGQYVMYFF